MSGVEILPDLFFFQRGYLNGNHFVYRNEEPILIDTAYKADFEITERIIARVGVDLGRVRLIVNTHCHCDHVGGNRTIQERSGCDIAMHKIGKHFIDTRDDWATWWRYYVQEADFFTCTQAFEDGDSISVGPHEFQVIYTPGHSADGIVLYHREAKILLSSDTLWEHDMAALTMRVEGSRAVFSLLESLERLRGLDVRMIYPGHGAPFTGLDAAVRKAVRRLEGYLEDGTRIGDDQLKKIIVYTLMMKRGANEETFFDYLMTTPWFVETIDLYFRKEYRTKYDHIMKGFLRKGIVKREHGRVFTTVTP
ncbi:MAG: MBL fold metallo-hydrolase [Desulfomonile tiedjei]|nr:MBL fold metallo-hydrolase [Desulfomonile tiedjei]